MSLRCFFCEQPIAETSSAYACPNCGAPISSQTDVSLATLQPTPSEILLQLDRPAARRSSSLLPRGASAMWTRQLPASGVLFEEPPAAVAFRATSTPADAHDLEGRIDTAPTKNTTNVPLERWSQGILYLFFPPLFKILSRYIFVVNDQSPQAPTKQTMTVYTLRIRRDDETLAEARLEGDILEGEPSLGDRVRLRGHYRGNTLIVDEGYNLSFVPTMRIKIRSPLPLRRARIAVVALATLLFTTLSCFLPFLSLFFYPSRTAHPPVSAQQYLLHHYLSLGIVFGLLAYVLFGISGWLLRLFILGLAVVVILAVYTALGGPSLFVFPINTH